MQRQGGDLISENAVLEVINGTNVTNMFHRWRLLLVHRRNQQGWIRTCHDGRLCALVDIVGMDSRCEDISRFKGLLFGPIIL